MGKLHIGAANHLYFVNNLISLLLKAFLGLFRDGQHGSRTEGITGMDAHGINVLNEADGDHLAFGIPNHLQFQFFPAHHRLFHQDLAHQAGL